MRAIYLKNKKHLKKTKLAGFTIVELLVVIVVIGILAAISIVSYNGITQRAKDIALQSDLTNAKTILSLYQVEHGFYPASLDGDNCPKDTLGDVDTKYCLKSSSGINLSYIPNTTNPQKFSLIATSDTSSQLITETLSPVVVNLFTANGSGRTGSIQTWTVPAAGTYTIEAWGAQGGGGMNGGGLGAYIKGDVVLNAGNVLKILVGQAPVIEGNDGYYGGSGGGGGGTFVTSSSNSPLIIAGGGGGYLDSSESLDLRINGQSGGAGATSLDNTGLGGYSGSGGNGSNNGWGGGGGGLTSNGTNSSQCSDTGGMSFVNGGFGGGPCSNWPGFASGGFGGGGGTHGNTGGGGGGGGYSGGGGSGQDESPNFGGGGGSYNSGSNQINSSGVNTGNGKVIIMLKL